MKKTTNYNLNKPEGSDYYNIADLNANADTLDSTIKGIADSIPTKATSTKAGIVKPDGTTTEVDSNGAIKVKGYSDKANKATSESMTLSATSWTGDSVPFVYDTGISTSYDVEVLLPNAATAEQAEACIKGMISGNGTDNKLRAWGEKPSIDIPVIVRKVAK